MKISDAYKAEQELQHIDPDYGQASVTYAPIVSQMCNRMRITELLDYGCGKARLMEHLDVIQQMKIQCYDPAIPERAGEPIPMQMVTCIDVLEHVEPECLEAVLDDLVRVTDMVIFLTICSLPAERTLSDGRNAHLIQKPMEWWLDKIMTRFDVQTLQVMPNGLYIIAFAKPKIIEGLQ